MSEDHQLLSAYVTEGSREALDALIRRHLPLVYSAARRQVRDAHLAEDVTQAVFLVLAQKARTIRAGTALGGWLVAVTRNASLNALKHQAIQKRHETMAATANIEEGSGVESKDTQDWERIASCLDEGMNHLPAKDRDAIVLRYFQDQSFAQIGIALAITDDTAQKRVARALDKLRSLLTRRGITLPAAALGVTLAARAVEAAPAHLLTQTLAATAGTTTAVTASLAKATLSLMAWAKFKVAAGLALAALLVTATAAEVVHVALAPKPPETRPIAAATATATLVTAPPAANSNAITGIVVDAAGRPVAQAKVERLNTSTSSATSAADGSFSTPASGAVYASFMAVSADESLMAFLQMNPAEGDKPATTLRLVLKPARTMEITVSDDKDVPVENSQLVAVADYRPVGQANSDARGHATLRFPADAPLQSVAAIKPGTGLDYAAFWRPGEVHNDPYRLDLDATKSLALTLNGIKPVTLQVTDDKGAPIADARVSSQSFRKPRKGADLHVSLETFRRRTDAAGIVNIDFIPVDEDVLLTLEAYKSGYVAMDHLLFDPKASPAQLTTILYKKLPLTGRVEDEQGNPVPGATVRIAGDAYVLSNYIYEKPTAADGTFSAEINPNMFYAFSAQKGQDISDTRFQLIMGDAPAPIILTLKPGQRVHGILTSGEDKTPVPNQVVRLNVFEDAYRKLPKEQQLLPKASNMAILPYITQTMTTQADGSYEFFAAPGEYSLAVDESQTEVSAFFTVKRGREQMADLHSTVSLTPPVLPKERSGRVVRADKPDEGVPDIGIMAIFADSKVYGRPPGAISGKDGRFKFGAVAYDYYLIANTPDRAWGTMRLVTANRDDIQLKLAATASITARLVDAAGKPVANQDILWETMIDTGNGTMVSEPAGVLGGYTRTDADGRFTAEGLLVGRSYDINTAKPSNVLPQPYFERDKRITTFTPDKPARRDLGDIVPTRPKEPVSPSSAPRGLP